MYSYDCKKRIRYGETDQMGYLYYGHYPFLYEIGRVEAIRSLGITYKHLEENLGIIMPVLYVESKYLLPVYYDEMIVIRSTLSEMPTKMISFHHEIFNESNQLVNRGLVKLFFIHKEQKKRISAPDYLTQKLLPFF
ncbi:MAG TPA: thioesterase family protein [Saprospiraceae bacterium]|nr:thioesterase family protein [Saprospiraceae bacterium]